MCGPIAFILPVDKSNKGKMIFQTFIYHFGRLLTYSLIGFLFALLGKGLYLAGFQQNLSIFVGILMILTVLLPAKLFDKLSPTGRITIGIGIVKQKLGLYLNKKSHKSIFLIGFFNGFLPCGLVYMALMGAISMSDMYTGSLYMFLFGLGTIPMMTIAVYLGNFLKTSIRNKIQKAIPIFVIIIGMLFILRGMGLGIPYVSPTDAKLILGTNPESCITE